jgi:hypothetical protein
MSRIYYAKSYRTGWHVEQTFATSSTTAAMVDNGPSTPKVYSQPVVQHFPLRSTVDGCTRVNWDSHIHPDANTTLDPEEMLQKLCPPDRRSHLPSLVPPTMRKRGTRGNSTYCDYLNKLSAKFKDPKCVYILPICPATHYISSVIYDQVSSNGNEGAP